MTNDQGSPSVKLSWGAVFALVGIVLVGFAHGGCGKGSGGSDAPEVAQGVHIVDLIISSGPISLQVSTTTTVTATAVNSDGTFTPNVPVTWGISPANYATITGNQLTATATPGLTNLTATLTSNTAITKSILVNVTSAPVQPPTVNPGTGSPSPLSAGTEGNNYGPVTLSLVGGQGPYLWSIKTGSLPSGLTLNSTLGTIGGSAAWGSYTGSPYSFTVLVTDASGATDEQQFSIVINQNTSPSGSPSNYYTSF